MPLPTMPAPGAAPEATNLPAESTPLPDQAHAALQPSTAGDGAPHARTPEPIEGALTVHNGNISHAARQLRMSRGTLYQRLKHWRRNAPE